MGNILLVGTDPRRNRDLRSLLRQDGHTVSEVTSVQGWRAAEARIRPEIVVASTDSPDPILRAYGKPGSGFPPPLLVVQHEAEWSRDIHLDDRLVDQLTSPFLGEELLGRVDGLIRVRSVVLRDRGAGTGSSDKGGLAALASKLRSTLSTRVPRFDKPLGPYLEVAARVARWTDQRDAFTPGHAERVTELCAMMGEAIALDTSQTSSLLRAAMLHDIGKVGIPLQMLHQRTPLEAGQVRLMRTHPRRGAELLRAMDPDEAVANTILYHHERPDGSGYYGLGGSQIPLSARILAVAEVFDAMTQTRLTEPLSREEALERLTESGGKSLDAHCVAALKHQLRDSRGAGTAIPLSPL